MSGLLNGPTTASSSAREESASVARPINTRKPYPEEFKREAVELLRTSGRPLAQIARELGVSVESLRLWRKHAEIDAGENEGLSSEREIDAGENEGVSSEEREKPRRLHHAVGGTRIWREAVELLRTSGRPLARIARELGVSVESLRLWRKHAEIDAGENEGLSSEEREKPRRLHHAVKRERIRIGVSMTVAVAAVTAAVVFLLVPLVGRGADDGPDAGKAQQAASTEPAIAGSFVGEVSGTDAFVAVVAAPAEGGKDSGAVQIYVYDGRGLSEWFSGPISDSRFVAKSDDGDVETEGRLSGDSVTGTVVLPGGKTVRYEASPPSGAAGFYELTVSAAGELSGASAAGLAVTGEIPLGKRGTGMLRMVDGKRLEFAVTRKRAGDLAHLRAGQVHLIVLAGGELRGAGKGRPSGGGSSDLFIRPA